ncbi:glycosyl transferase [Heyndrickxia shackletonii]|uniref:Glycosyl transferase n=1 Tax=Heyndrickxia shackletonii TaxID=157838 RepID=A0A0Q3WW09_9BACI|nr:glycosyltransferase family 2 protein [Heyndrickxia shackletonii]KQL54082.1 glycosyl transferase [Heyndrickxia shackletonii]NEY99365.1 glycosyltransferase family 2 protein [Heyndrickxia shackletonii]
MINLRKFKKKNYTIVDNKIEYLNNQPKVTVITPVYNAEKYLRKTIESVISQTLGIDNIEYILVDDCSKDQSRKILLEYCTKFPTIKSVFLKGNTGTPGQPRNIGIELSTSKYITFLDADDWLEPNGLEILFNILEETNDDYIVGKTIEVQQNGTKIVGEHESCKERRIVSPYSIPHIFQHLGPRARMCRTDLLKTNKIYFPEMKFAEDKQFFIDVLTACRSISTTTAPIYYLNRVDNSGRLTNQTNILQKTNCNLKVIQYVIKKNLDVEKEKMILNRLYEFDSISRFFNTPHFQRTRLKFIYYFTFRRVLRTAKFLRYEFSENFSDPLNKVVYELFRNRKYKELVKLLEWNKKEKIKEIHIKENLPYFKVPFLDEPFRYIRSPMFALVKEESILENKYILHFKVYGTNKVSITDIIIRNSKDVLFEHHFEVEMEEDGNGRVIIDLVLLKHLPPAHYSIYLRFNDYMKINIRKIDTKQSKRCFQNRDYIFYQTRYSNVGLKINSV